MAKPTSDEREQRRQQRWQDRLASANTPEELKAIEYKLEQNQRQRRQKQAVKDGEDWPSRRQQTLALREQKIAAAPTAAAKRALELKFAASDRRVPKTKVQRVEARQGVQHVKRLPKTEARAAKLAATVDDAARAALTKRFSAMDRKNRKQQQKRASVAAALKAALAANAAGSVDATVSPPV